MRRRVLIIDDDAELGEMLAEFLAGEGLDADCVHDGESGLAAATDEGVDAVVLDVMLPGIGGFDVLRGIRARSTVPVIMLTARGEDADRIVGLELGADDYLPKPFNPRELAARLRAVLRRSAAAEAHGEPARSGTVELDPLRRQVTVEGAAQRLTGAEFAVLEKLLEHPGELVSRDALCEHALGRRLSPYDRSIDTHISRLRGKLGPLRDGQARIQSVRGRGYRFVPEGP